MFPKIDNALLNIGSGANQLVQLGTGGKLPAVDASLLNSLPSSSGGSGMNLLATQVVTSPVSQIDFTNGIDGTYKEYMVRGTDITLSTTSVFGARVRIGGSFTSGSNYTYGGRMFGNSTAAVALTNANNDHFLLIPSDLSFVATYGNAGFVLNITNPSGTSRTKAMHASGGGNGNGYNQGYSYFIGGALPYRTNLFGVGKTQASNLSFLPFIPLNDAKVDDGKPYARKVWGARTANCTTGAGINGTYQVGTANVCVLGFILQELYLMHCL